MLSLLPTAHYLVGFSLYTNFDIMIFNSFFSLDKILTMRLFAKFQVGMACQFLLSKDTEVPF